MLLCIAGECARDCAEHPWPENLGAEVLPLVSRWLAQSKLRAESQIKAVEHASLMAGSAPDAIMALCTDPRLVVKLRKWHDEEGASVRASARQLLAASTTCTICMDTIGPGNASVQLASSSNHSWEKSGCSCMFCRGCMSTYVEGKIKEHRVHHIPCPTPTCKAQLFEADVKNATSKAVFERFQELRQVDHKARIKEFAGSELATFFKTRACPCPRCSLIIEKNEGCETMVCVCGHSFDWNQAARAHKLSMTSTTIAK